jgi:putative transposase
MDSPPVGTVKVIRKEARMPRGRRHTHEQIMSLLEQIEATIAMGKGIKVACYQAGISEPTYFRWRAEFCSLKMGELNRLRDLEQENVKLKRLAAAMSSVGVNRKVRPDRDRWNSKA